MACPRVCVTDTSASVRETIGIVLGADYEVVSLLPEELARHADDLAKADVVIAAVGLLSADLTAKLRGGPALVWLEAPGGGQGGKAVGTLPRTFTPAALKAAVATAISERTARRAPPSTGLLDYPLVPRAAATLARRAAQTNLPVLICGEPGIGKSRLVQAIHALSSNRQLIKLGPGRCQASALSTASGGTVTVFVNQLEALSAEEQQFLLALLETGGTLSENPGSIARLICATSQSYDHLSESNALDRALFYRLSVLPISLPPLRQRIDELPAIVTTVAQQQATELGVVPPTFTATAMHRLSHYLWFGNLAELETVLARSLALAQDRPLDVGDLLFGYGPLVEDSGTSLSDGGTDLVGAGQDRQAVDLIINELAHEFKNPMVTIKTITQHLDRLLSDEAGRQHVAQLTGEAVERMDRVLENLLQFTRFRTPAPTAVALNALLAPCLSELAPLLTERRVVLNYQPPEPMAVYVDPEQTTYAIENLLRAVVRDLGEGETVTIRAAESTGRFSVEFNSRGQGVADRLNRFLDASPEEIDPALPLGLLFARTLIQRNGGTFDLHMQAGRGVVTVGLPAREGIASKDGKTTDSHC